VAASAVAGAVAAVAGRLPSSGGMDRAGPEHGLAGVALAGTETG